MQYPFPGQETTSDGSAAALWVEKSVSQGACAYPITPSTPMGVGYQYEVAQGTKNLWGEPLVFLEPESEHSSASACEGFALAGGRVANFTSGQGLILMKEVLYVISGKRLPMVFHIGARALSRQALNVHAGHDDVMGVADCGFGMLFARNAQDVADLALIARRVSEATRTPFFCVQDGFLTTHTVESVRLPEPELMEQFVQPPAGRVPSLFDPAAPLQSGVVQNPDAYMAGRTAQRACTDRVLPALIEALQEFQTLTGRSHHLVESEGMEDAEIALVGMGSMMETAAATAAWMRGTSGKRVGVVHVTAFRPFPGPQVVRALRHVRSVAVIERLDDELAQSGPLATEIKAAFADAAAGMEGYPLVDRIPPIHDASAGLGGRDVRPGDFIALVDAVSNGGTSRRWFALGVEGPLALPRAEDPDLVNQGTCVLRCHSIGGLGSVTANKVLAYVLGGLPGLKILAWSMYGSEKKGLPTTSTLVAAHHPVRIHCDPATVDFVSVYDGAALRSADTLHGLRTGGRLFVQTPLADPMAVWESLPVAARTALAEGGIRVCYLDADRIARELAPTPALERRMQGVVQMGVYLRTLSIMDELRLPQDDLMARVEESLARYFGRHGEDVLRLNMDAVRRGFAEVAEVPESVIRGTNAARVLTG